VSRVLIVGVGGLGCPAALALVDAGVERLRLIDPDRLERSNLHRQILYRDEELGRPKAELAAARLEARGARVEAVVGAFRSGDARLLDGVDLVLDGTDRFETKLAIADACNDRGLPYVFAGVVGWEGQVLGVRPGRSACPRCLFEEAPPPGAAATCAELGVIGPVAGVVGARQAAVALALLAGDDAVLDRLWVYDGRRDRARHVPLRRDPDCRGCGRSRALRGVTDVASGVPPPPDRQLDLRGEVCPTTFVATRRALERLAPGARLEVLLDSDESARGVPASAIAAGYRVLARRSDGVAHQILIEVPEPDDTAPAGAEETTTWQ
jgi:molybdopterin/thiamine biosynthesis adenylyltransferase/TusA-related sulfurtransferase